MLGAISGLLQLPKIPVLAMTPLPDYPSQALEPAGINLRAHMVPPSVFWKPASMATWVYSQSPLDTSGALLLLSWFQIQCQLIFSPSVYLETSSMPT